VAIPYDILVDLEWVMEYRVQHKKWSPKILAFFSATSVKKLYSLTQQQLVILMQKFDICLIVIYVYTVTNSVSLSSAVLKLSALQLCHLAMLVHSKLFEQTQCNNLTRMIRKCQNSVVAVNVQTQCNNVTRTITRKCQNSVVAVNVQTTV